MGGERAIERDGALLGQCSSGAIMDGGWSHQADAAVAVFMVVPVEEPLAVSTGVFDRAEAIGEVGSVFQSFELRLGIRIVVLDVRAAVGLGDIEVDQERGNGLRSHAGTAIGMERQGARRDVLLLHSVGDELLGEFSGLAMSDEPADDVAAEDVEDHVKMEAGPFGRTLQLGDVPRPHFVWPDRQQFRLGVDGMNSLTTALTGLIPSGQEPIHGAD